MFSTQSVEYSIGTDNVRAISAIPERDAWIVGTCGNDRNVWQVIAYDTETNELLGETPQAMEERIRCLASVNQSTVAMATEQGSSVLLYDIPNDTEPSVASHPTAKLTPDGSFGASIIDLNVRESSLLVLDNTSHLSRWDLETCQEVKSVDLETSAAKVVQWDPHSSESMMAIASQRTLHVLDWRTDTSIPTGIVSEIFAKSIITDIDYNPNKPHTVAIASQDGKARIWDLRQSKRPLLTLTGGHSHWMSTIHYNPFHDQLVLTTGTEGKSNVWRLSSVSSAPLLQSNNRRVAHHANSSHEAIYASSWAASEAWMYVTVAWDGTMILHHVPSKEKYKILL